MSSGEETMSSSLTEELPKHLEKKPRFWIREIVGWRHSHVLYRLLHSGESNETLQYVIGFRVGMDSHKHSSAIDP